MTELNIIKGLKEYSEEAFNEMFYKYKNLVFFVINDIVKSTEDSEDLLIETFEDAYAKIESFSGDSLKAWILRIAKNKAINYYNKNKNINIISEEDLYNVSSNDEDHLLERDLKKVLNYQEFTSLILFSVYDMKQKEIASYLNIPIGTVGWILSEAKAKAKKYLKGE